MISDFNVLNYCPNHTDYIEWDSNYRLLCVTLAENDIIKAKNFYENEDIEEVFEWHYWKASAGFDPNY